MKTRRWKLKVSIGWYRGIDPMGFRISIFEPIQDYPKGWAWVSLLSIQIAKIEFVIGLDKLYSKEVENKPAV